MIARCVIVGGGAAGVNAALSLRKLGYDGDIVLVCAEDRLPYERPAVSKDVLLTGRLPPIVPERVYAELRVDLRLGRRASRLRAGAVELDDGTELHTDKVLIATGGRVRQLRIPGAELSGVHYVRFANDGEAIRAELRPGARVAVIGGGLIGAEVSASAIQAGCDVDWIEAGYRCMTRSVSHPLDEALMAIHRERGVRIHTRMAVVRVLGDARVAGVELSDGRRLDADVVVVGIGIDPDVDLARASGIDVDDGIVVDAFNATSMPNVYAAGDVTHHKTRHMAAAGRLEHWRYAQSHGEAAARSMLGRGEAFDELPWFWTDQYDHHVEGCGLPRASDEVVVRGELGAGAATAFYLREGRLVGATSLDRPNDVRAAMRLIARGLTPTHTTLQDTHRDLRKVEKEMSHAIS